MAFRLTRLLNNIGKLTTVQDNIVPASKPTLDKLFKSVEIECRGHDKAVLQSYFKFVSTSANHLNISLQDVTWPRYHLRRWTLLKSAHVHKKHRVQYEVRTQFVIIKFLKLTQSTAETFLEYIQRNLPEGVAMKVTKEELLRLPDQVEPSSNVHVTKNDAPS